jgi:hypothetical protein
MWVVKLFFLKYFACERIEGVGPSVTIILWKLDLWIP